MDCLFFGICKVYVKMTVVLNIPIGSFAVLLRSIYPPKLPKVKLPSLFYSGPFYPPKTAKSTMDLAVLLWVKWT